MSFGVGVEGWSGAAPSCRHHRSRPRCSQYAAFAPTVGCKRCSFTMWLHSHALHPQSHGKTFPWLLSGRAASIRTMSARSPFPGCSTLAVQMAATSQGLLHLRMEQLSHPKMESADRHVVLGDSSSILFLPSAPTAMTQLHPLHQRMLTQRQMSSMESQPPEEDPYPTLMSSVEKDWVIKVQMLQLQSENPHKDDYYYQEYYRKLEYKQVEKGSLGGCKPDVPKLVTPYIQKVETYESVMRIPGSLGQVAMSTCYSPRRAIDAVHHIQLEQATGNQHLQVLYHIEKVRKLELASEEQSIQAGCCHHLFSIKIPSCLDAELSDFFSRENKDEFLHILLVGKGKRLVARLLPYLSREQAKRILVNVTQHLPLLIQKDVLDEMLPILYHPLSDVIEQLTFSEMINILQEIIDLQPESVKQSLAMVFGNKFAISLLYLLLSHGERSVSSGVPLNLHNGEFEKWVDTVLFVAKELSQVPKTSMAEPLHLPSNLLFLFCRYVDKDTVNRLDVKMEVFAWKVCFC
uniref:PAT1 homolog 2 n=1 Tax=Salvator merianae TaxID=96440 RepID=A0A8D0B165_SALMN